MPTIVSNTTSQCCCTHISNPTQKPAMLVTGMPSPMSIRWSLACGLAIMPSSGDGHCVKNHQTGVLEVLVGTNDYCKRMQFTMLLC